jgi:hypothetical protein
MKNNYDQREDMHAVNKHREQIAKAIDHTDGKLESSPVIIKDGKSVTVEFASHRDAIAGCDSITELMRRLTS